MTEPAQRRTAEDGSKFYEHPSRTEEVRENSGGNGMVTIRPARYVSVTSALSVHAKPKLTFWAANCAASRAMTNLPRLIAAARIDDCGRARGKVEPLGCKVCTACVEVWVAEHHIAERERRAREGSAAHDVLEAWILTGEWVYTPRADWGEWAPTAEQVQPYIRALQQFIADYGLSRESFLVAECTVWNHTFRYAGTLDAVIEVRPVTKASADFCARVNEKNGLAADQRVRVVVDCKSREGEGAQLYAEHPLQLGAYRFAETMTPKFAAPEMEMAMIATDGAAVLQVRPDGYAFRPVVTDGNTMKAFRAILDLAAWDADHGEADTLVRAFPRPDGWKPPTWQRATDPTGALCGCPYCDDPGDSRCMFGGERPLGKHTKTPKPAPAAKPVLSTAVPPIVERMAATAAEREVAPPKKRTTRKAAVKRASTPIEAMITGQRVLGAEIDDEDIPF